MNRTLRPARHHRVRCRPRLERLESLQLLDAGLGNLAVLSTTPANGATLSQSPTDLIVQFNQPFKQPSSPPQSSPPRSSPPQSSPPGSVNHDIVLERVSSDGQTAKPMAIQERFNLGAPTDTLDVAVNQTLDPGLYKIVLSGSATITGLQGQPLANQGKDKTLADFTILPGVMLADAHDLTPGTPVTPAVVPSFLNFQAPKGEAQLFKFTLSASQPLWLLGAEVSAQSDGGTLLTSLVLLDDRGDPIAYGEYGRNQAPNDPYLFAGLKPGTYYLGVSGKGDLPGQPGGYDPVTGTPGTVVQNQPSGSFQLHVAADPALPTTLLSFQLDQADPLDPTPTGLTLQFSGALLNPETANMAQNINQSIEVVDSTGHVYPVLFSGYSEADARISFLFKDRLPQGDYTVRLPKQVGLVDLAGLSPVAPGQPAGVLGTFSVEPSKTPEDPHDLGALLPNAALDGISFYAQLNPGDSVTYRIVITFRSSYILTSSYSGSSLAISRVGPDGTIPVDPGSPMDLTPGVYQFLLRANGPQPVLAHLVLHAGPPESLQENGIGQGPALSLMLISPVYSPGDSGGGSTGGGTGGGAGRGGAGLGTGGGAGAPTSPTTTVSQQVPSGLFLGLGGDLVGRPSPVANPPATVSLGSYSEVITFTQDILIPQRIGSGSGPRGSYSSDAPPLLEVDAVLAVPTDRATVADSVLHDLAHGGPLQLNESKLGRLGLAIARWFETRVAEGSGTQSGVEDSWSGIEDAPHEAGLVPVGAKQSGITSSPAFKSAVVILIILAIYRMYRWLNREWRWLARGGGLTT
jgi:hypothetical protein